MPHVVEHEKSGKWVLYTRDITLKNGQTHPMYYFVKEGNKPKSGEKCDLPDGFEVGFTKLGWPHLKRIKKDA